MSKEKSESLFLLIKSLSKSEKRYFKLFVSQQDSKATDKKFVRLFDVIDGMEVYDETRISVHAPELKASQLPNQKAHLYKRILQALRQYERGKLTDIDIREMIDYAELLFNRSLYDQCVEVLKKARRKAEQHDNLELLLEIYKWEKIVLSMTLSKNNEDRVNKIVKGVETTNNRINNINRFTNLTVKLNSLYLKMGYVKNRKDHEAVSKLFHDEMVPYDERRLSFTEKLNLYVLYVGYYFFIQDVDKAYMYAYKLVNMFDEKDLLMLPRLDMYIRGLNSLMIAQYKLNKYREFVETRNKLKRLNKLPSSLLNDNIRIKLFKYSYVHEFNRLFMLGNFKEGVERFERIEPHIDFFVEKLDKHSRMILFYKIACLYVGDSNYRGAVYWLNRIINTEYVENDMREDIHSFARILSLICHYELENIDVMEYLVRSTYRFLYKKGNLYLVHLYILHFLKKLNKEMTPKELMHEFVKLREQLLPLEDDPYERRPFIYFDIISWLQSKISGQPVEEIIQAKAKKRIGKDYPVLRQG
ncbi:hypothetical protein V6R21_10305 [Limibacter armeniacum]|uniref:hypothetical protein n=1 Tax=Limibacter armeniacum TaxID=466084 RepID=UPI002FE5D92A